MKFLFLILVFPIIANATPTAAEAIKQTRLAEEQTKKDYARMQRERDAEFSQQVDLDITSTIATGGCYTNSYAYLVSQAQIDKELLRLNALGYEAKHNNSYGFSDKQVIVISWCTPKK